MDIAAELPGPDDALKWAWLAAFGPGLAFSLFGVLLLVSAWLGAVRSTRQVVLRANGAVRAGRARLSRMPRAQVGALLLLSSLLLALLTAWVPGVLVMGNVARYALDSASQEEFVALDPVAMWADGLWTRWDDMTATYVLCAVILAVLLCVRRSSAGTAGWALALCLPQALWVVPIAAETLFTLLLGLPSALFGQGSGLAEVPRNLVFVGVFAMYYGSCAGALAAAQRLGLLWLGPAAAAG
ncbi:hypothetical protein ABT112_31990 [Streptomyces sp. NPDC002055]|uniref:hypothetical protein n=1 Tax=Streptomyces sp. NPDC002055 TaxID=3154534 RepID=UPI003330B0FF